MALNVDTSIVDYLKSIGQDNSFQSRSNLYTKSGLKLGGYSGTAQQNTSLLSYLKGNQPAASPQPGGAPATAQAVTASPQAGPTNSAITPRMDYVKELSSQIISADKAGQEKVNQSRQDLLNFYANLEPTSSRYERLRTEQNLPQQEELVNSLAKNALDTEQIIEDLDPAVTERSKDFLMTEADRVSLLAKEREPLQKSLNKTLQQKQREEVGLSNKQSLVRELLNFSLQDDERKGKALQLNVDYTEADRKNAMSLLQDILGQGYDAYNRDLKDYQESATRQEEATIRAAEREQDFQERVYLENLSSKNSLSRSLALKSAGQNQQQASKKTKQATDNSWNNIIGGTNSVDKIGKYIKENKDKLASTGADVNDLWSRYLQLKAEKGAGGTVRKVETTKSGGVSGISSRYNFK